MDDIVATDAELTERDCPGCGKPLPANAILCVACGYHLQQERFLATMVDRTAALQGNVGGDNPYAAPVSVDVGRNRRVIGAKFDPDLTTEGAKWASSLVRDAEAMRWVIVVAYCLAGPLILIAWPWCLYRLSSWYTLNRSYSELAFPNAMSKHCDLAIRFQDAYGRLWRGAILGGILFVPMCLYVLLMALRALNGQPLF